MILAVVMILGSVSVAAYAADYKGNDTSIMNSLQFDDVNSAVYSSQQYATMCLDALDKLLAEANLDVNIYIGRLNGTNVDNLLGSVNSLWDSVGGLVNLGILGDAKLLDLSAIANTHRGNDLSVIYDVLDLLGDLAPIAQKYVQGDLSLGSLNSVIANYLFNVRSLVFGLVIGLTDMGPEGYDYMDSKTVYFSDDTIPVQYSDQNNTVVKPGATMPFLQNLLNKLILGKWQKLDDLFYETGHKQTNIAYKEIQFHDGSATGAIVTDAEPDINAYDYYGWVHPDDWVTTGLGDAIRVANGAAAPAPSYTKVNVKDMQQNGTVVYNLVEDLLLQAYNGIAVPVLNRIVKNWLREKAGYTFESKYTEKYLGDVDAEGNPVINPDYDYLYGGTAPEGGKTYADNIFQIFDVDNLKVPYAVVPSGSTFIDELNHNAFNFLTGVLECTYEDATINGVLNRTFTWKQTAKDEETGVVSPTGLEYSFTVKDGGNELLLDNAVSLVRFVLKVSENEFFSDSLIDRGEVLSPTEIDDLDNQGVLAYIARSVINALVPYMYISAPTQTTPELGTLAGVGFEAVLQLAAQDIPQFTYTAPKLSDYNNDLNAYNHAVVEKALAILMDVAAYNLNSVLDADMMHTATNASYSTLNDGTDNDTGLIGYLGDDKPYGNTIAAISAWAVTKWASTTDYSGNYDCLLNLDLGSDNYGGQFGTGKVTEATFWSDIDTILDSIIPIKANNKPWIYGEIASQNPVSKSLIFDYLIYPILNLNIDNILKIFKRNNASEFNEYTLERVLVNLLRRIFNDLFPNVFSAGTNTIDGILDNTLLGKMVYDLVKTLSATGSATGLTNGGTITGRGKIIAGVALPIVALALGLDAKQEFGELDNLAPSLIKLEGNDISFQIYNGSSGVNTSYRNPSGLARNVDKLFTYLIEGTSCEVVGGGTHTVEGVDAEVISNGVVTTQGTQIAGGQSKTITIRGITSGELLKITFKYRVLDETGTSLGQSLYSIKYVYCADDIEGDDDQNAHAAGGGNRTIDYASHVYLPTGKGLSSLEGYSIVIHDSTNGAATASVNGVSGLNWVSKETNEKETSVNMDGQSDKSVYILYPFAVDSDHYRRTEYNYKTNADGSYVLDDWGRRVKDTVKTEAGVTNINDGNYTINVNLTVAGSNINIPVKVHLYDDGGLPGLLDSAVKANRTTDTIDQAGTGRLGTYNAAVATAAGIVYPPMTHGDDFQTWLWPNGTGSTKDNRFQAAYKTLYTQVNGIKPYDLNAGALSLWNAVNSKQPYNYTRASYEVDIDGVPTTVYYRNWKEYYESGYGYMGMRNYVAHTYKVFKSAVNYANDLIAKEYKYVDVSPEDYAKMTHAQKEDFINNGVKNYLKDVEENTGVITPVESVYAIHRLNTAYSRLISINGDRSKLNAAFTKFGAAIDSSKYTDTSVTDFNNAREFANTVKNGSNNPEQINTAMSKLIEAWKNLLRKADWTNLDNAVDTASAELDSIGCLNSDGTPNYDEVNVQETYDRKELVKFMDLYLTSYLMDTEKSLGLADQQRIDEQAAALLAALANLPEFVANSFEIDVEWGQIMEGRSGDETYELKLDEEVIAEYLDLLTADNFGQLNPEYVDGDGNIVVNHQSYDSIQINGVIVGIPYYAFPEDIEGLLNVSGGYIVTLPYLGPGSVGWDDSAASGTLLFIFDEYDELQATYLLALRGDLNNDGDITSNDVGALELGMRQAEGYDFGNETAPEMLLFTAADVNNDWIIDSNDLGLLEPVAVGQLYDQAEGKLITSEE